MIKIIIMLSLFFFLVYTLNQLTAPWEAHFESNRDWIYRFLRTIHTTTLRLFLFLYIVHYQIFKTNILNSLPIQTRKCLFNAKCNIMVLKIIQVQIWRRTILFSFKIKSYFLLTMYVYEAIWAAYVMQKIIVKL